VFSDTVTLFPVGLNQISPMDTGLKIYPNPTSSKLFVELKDTNAAGFTAIIFDQSGKEISRKVSTGTISEMDIENLNSGTFVIQIIKGRQTVSSQFILQKQK
jgi:hypothetical protein